MLAFILAAWYLWFDRGALAAGWKLAGEQIGEEMRGKKTAIV